jgi:DNA-binding transcriptional MerR regulator
MTNITSDELRHRAGLWTIGEVADILGIQARRFRYFIEAKRIFGPKMQIGEKPRRYYTKTELNRIQNMIKQL